MQVMAEREAGRFLQGEVVMDDAYLGGDPMTRHAAREQSLEGVPESSGYVLFIPDCGGQGHERGHISDRLSECCF